MPSFNFFLFNVLKPMGKFLGLSGDKNEQDHLYGCIPKPFLPIGNKQGEMTSRLSFHADELVPKSDFFSPCTTQLIFPFQLQVLLSPLFSVLGRGFMILTDGENKNG